uniref:Uncharacterized protein n=1 Tax=Arundo donax TaxID=35708 RepID=A0A0A8YG76_ARUDO
MGYILQSILGD